MVREKLGYLLRFTPSRALRQYVDGLRRERLRGFDLPVGAERLESGEGDDGKPPVIQSSGAESMKGGL